MVPVYTVEETFRQRAKPIVAVGDEIPMLYGTDTGYVQDLPSKLNNDTEGFLGVLNLVGGCYVEGQYESPYPASSASGQPYIQ